MIKITMCAKNIEKYFDHRRKKTFPNYILSPKTKEIFKYYQYIKNYGDYKNDSYNLSILKLKTFEDYANYEIDKDIIIDEEDILEFEFPDDMEEEAFYFKMKYAGL